VRAAFRATHALVDSGTTHWFLLFAFRDVRHRPSCRTSTTSSGPRAFRRAVFVHRLLVGLDRLFFSACVRDALGVSPECGGRSPGCPGGRTRFRDYRAQFGQDDFTTLPPPQLDDRSGPDHVRGPGSSATRASSTCSRSASGWRPRPMRRFEFEVCGGGSAYEELQAAVPASGGRRSISCCTASWCGPACSRSTGARTW
jgi:hypothetical protein